MKPIDAVNFETKKQRYQYMRIKLVGLIAEEPDPISNLSNASALMNLLLDHINWVGFYFVKENALKLGPFQGKPACVDLQFGKGVCGTAAQTKEIQLVRDVHAFEGHVACDPASNSEIVLPILVNDQVVAVLDIDSPVTDRFDLEDQEGLEKIVATLVQYIDWSFLR